MPLIHILFRLFFRLFALFLLMGMAGVGTLVMGFFYYSRDLPDYSKLSKYEPPVATRIYASDGRLMEEYAKEKRVFVPIEVIPQHVVDAFLSAEDKDFYSHFGIDFVSIAGAVVRNIPRFLRGQRMVGASTITQQVAKNFLLSNEYRLTRKIKEAILSLRIERAFTKDHILQLYLNDIFLGQRSFGVAAAALTYFNKPLEELTIAQAAYLAILPKAPSNYHPVRNHQAALDRRNWVIGRMLEDGKITTPQADAAWAEPLVMADRQVMDEVRSEYFAEEVRRELLARYGEKSLYEGGLFVRVTLDPVLQEMAVRALQKGLIAYDRRHGWRGPVGRLASEVEWQSQIKEIRPEDALDSWKMALVKFVETDHVVIAVEDGGMGAIPLAEMKWARPWVEGQKVGKAVKSARDVLAPGDVVLVETAIYKPGKPKKGKKREVYPKGTYTLRQVPDVDGAIIVMDPHTGRVLAMQGGFSSRRSQFNRATQAKRQPGSSFKPFVYLAALEQGYPPNTIVYDEPFVLDQGPGTPKWRPKNYDGKEYGPSTLRIGIEKSRNLMTVRLAHTLGMNRVSEIAKRFGIDDNMAEVLAMSLGAGETTLQRMAGAYSMIVNGGKRITPSFIDRIQNRNGRTIYRHDNRGCPDCKTPEFTGQPVPEKVDNRETVVDAMSAYQMASFMRGVVLRGTATRASRLGIPVGGKTGTTNNAYDAWFMGFSADLVVGTYVGFDKPKSLGRKETGGQTALPIFINFMGEATKYRPAVPFRVPPGIRFVRIHRETGYREEGKGTIVEAFKPEGVPEYGEEPPYVGYGTDFAGEGLLPGMVQELDGIY